MSESVNGEVEPQVELEDNEVETIVETDEPASPEVETEEEADDNQDTDITDEPASEDVTEVEEKKLDDVAAKSEHGFRKRLGAQRKGQLKLQKQLEEANAYIQKMAANVPEPLIKQEYETDTEFMQRNITTQTGQAMEQGRVQAYQQQLQAEMGRQNESIQVSKMEDASTRYTDFDQAIEVASRMQLEQSVSEHINGFIHDSDVGGDILYTLGKTPELAERLSEMTPRARERQLMRMETQLETNRPQVAPKAPVAKKKPMPAKKAGATKATDTNKMDMVQYRDFRRKQRAAGRTRK